MYHSMASAAKLAGMSPRHLHRRLEADKVRTFFLGRKLMMTAVDLEAWLTERKKRVPKRQDS